MLQPGDRIGPYRIDEVIGSGGFATVFVATDDRLRNTVAIKVLADNHAASPDLRRRFFDEGHLLRKADSEALVTIYDVGEQDGQPYLVLDHCDRGDLASRIEARPIEPTADDVRLLIRHLGAALADLQALGIAHRDIKPSNVLLSSRPSMPVENSELDLGVFDADDRLLLSDLGLAKNLAAGSGITMGAGTSSFAAPEQREWLGTISTGTDIYGASALVHWFVTGRPPRQNSPGVVARGDGSIASGFEGSLHALVQPALIRGMSEKPEDRHAGAEEWSTDLLDRLAESGDGVSNSIANVEATIPAEPAQRSSRRGLGRVGVKVGLAAGAVLLAGAGALTLADRSTTQDDDLAQPLTTTTEPADATTAAGPVDFDDEPADPVELDAPEPLAIPDVDLQSGPLTVAVAGNPGSLVSQTLAGLDGLESDPRFAAGSFELSADTTAAADELATVLVAGPLVELRGFDDGDSNPVLGEERARAIQRHLVESHGLSARLLLVSGAEATADDQRGAVGAIVRDRADGGLLESHWNRIPDLWEAPTLQRIVPGLRSFDSQCESACAVQVEGVLTPLESGEHTFSLMADRQAELWLSETGDPADLQLLVAVGQADRRDDGTATASSSVTLTVGRPVYVRLRAVHGQEKTGAWVVWQTPFSDGTEWVSSTVLTPPERE